MFRKLFKHRLRKINVGSAGINYDETWYPTDINTLDITKREDWKKLLGWHKVENIMAEHVWEHLSSDDCENALINCFSFLKKNGKLRIAVPDGLFPNESYINHVKPDGTGPGADDHKFLYNYKTLGSKMKKAGFVVKPIEYWDENGVFHKEAWSEVDGFIQRSADNDERNKDGVLRYTSLIIDGIKTT